MLYGSCGTIGKGRWSAIIELKAGPSDCLAVEGVLQYVFLSRTISTEGAFLRFVYTHTHDSRCYTMASTR